MLGAIAAAVLHVVRAQFAPIGAVDGHLRGQVFLHVFAPVGAAWLNGRANANMLEAIVRILQWVPNSEYTAAWAR